MLLAPASFDEFVILWPRLPGVHLETAHTFLQNWGPVAELPSLVSLREGELRFRLTAESGRRFFRLSVSGGAAF